MTDVAELIGGVGKAKDCPPPDIVAAPDQAMLDIGQELALSAEHADSHDLGEPMAWLPDWYCERLAEIDAVEAAVKANIARLLAECETRRKALAWKYGAQLQAEVVRRLEGKKAKSIQCLTGRCGFRASGGRESVVIVDEPSVIQAAETSCPAAVKVEKHILKAELLKHVHATGEMLLGMTVETTPKVETFFAASTTVSERLLDAPVKQTETRIGADEYLNIKPTTTGGSAVNEPFGE